ncbi:ATP-binding protein [Azotobacter bryophylli]|uniref:ATP-binding protein n=1 Tax=Azotobacter bryophylli TaxID=1986537 RepID=A0ABV7B1M8_9GAMM
MARNFNFTRRPEVVERDVLLTICPVPGHGGYMAAEVEQFDGSYRRQGCPKCLWEALNLAPIGSDARAQAAAMKRAERVNALLVGSGISPRFRECTLENYRTDGGNAAMVTALETCRQYVERFEEHYAAGRCLLLLGNVGTGKTHLASAMAQALIRQHLAAAVITTAGEVIRVAKEAMDRKAGYTERDVLNELAGFDLLVLDEVGAQAGTEYERGLLHEVIDRRYQSVLPTILISNLCAADLAKYIGDRALDRLRQGGGLRAGFTWESLRRRA